MEISLGMLLRSAFQVNNFRPEPPMRERLARLHELFWRTSDPPHHFLVSSSVPNMISSENESSESTFQIVDLPQDAIFPDDSSTMLVLKVYEEFWDLLCEDDNYWENIVCTQRTRACRFLSSYHATVISGQPGIGKCISCL